MTTTTDTDRLLVELAKAEQRAEAARRKAEEAAAREAERKAEAERRFDEAVIAYYDPGALDDAVSEAQKALEAALDADPVVRAAIGLRQAQGARHGAAILANAIRQRLGMDPVPVPGPGLVSLESFIARYIERRGAELVADAEDAFHAARERAAGV